ncbi:hypothetical protein GGS20DRAFT_281313 [Poronia punctata]|nr:hypothetical protein GGS20DRAFT_281313 [Poronia punctata]
MTYAQVKSRHAQPPPRPRTAVDYCPSPVDPIHPIDAHDQLLNSDQRGSGVGMVHLIPRERVERLRSSEQVPTPYTPTSMGRLSRASTRSTLQAARDGLVRGLSFGKATLDKTKPAVEAAVSASKKVVEATAHNISQVRNSRSNKNNVKGPDGRPMSRRSSNSTLYAHALRDAKRLPKLKIPDLNTAVEAALDTALSTETVKSDNFHWDYMSPTSRDLKLETMNKHDDDHSDDVANEYRNMLSARRRVRKSKFGAEVARYRLARPSWDEPCEFLRSRSDNPEDRELIAILTNALQEQKDRATMIVQRNPNPYPGFRRVSQPGCTKTMYWQHKSTYN